MSKIKLIIKRSTAVLLTMLLLCGTIPSELISELNVEELFLPLIAVAEEAEQKVSTESSDVEYIAPDCSFKDELYDGSDAISPLPTYQEYKEQTGYTEPLRISFTDFRKECGEGLNFNIGIAQSYMVQGYKLMICNAEELYNYSMIVNGAGSSDETSFYLSANIVLGDNIEYSDMSYHECYFLPIGNDNNAFTGTFDGQGFEIRDLYFDKSYTYVTVGFFGVVGEGAEVTNFGLFHPTIIASGNNSTYTAAIASRNFGLIDSVYAIAQEYSNTGTVAEINIISTANALSASGLVAYNYESGTLSNSYFAGMLYAADPVKQHPVCAENAGTIINCYYDSEVFACGFSGSTITEVEGEIIGLSNINLKKMNGMENTKFKVNAAAIDVSRSNTTNQCWSYPHLYGFTGTGTEEDPFLISTPADLVYFPNSVEFTFTNPLPNFQLSSCIDMNEVAPNAYKPHLDFELYSNQKSGSTFIQNQYSYKNRAFYGKISGAAHYGDEECPICHVTDLGVDANGNPLQECHAILNLTINQPATTTSDLNKNWTAFIPYASSRSNATYFPTVSDLHFIGGEISSGDKDCLPTTYNSGAYNVKTATVIGYSEYADMKNVHSSATVKMGTGKQYSVVIGGLMASGYFHNITDCTNSGNVIGGYLNMVDQAYLSENYRIGGLLGSAGSNSLLQERYIGKLTHVANYGNVFGTVVVAPKDGGWKLTGGTANVAGITTGNLASNQTGQTSQPPQGQSTYYYDDNYRVDRVANFGNLFDGPIELDDYGKPIFDDTGKLQPLSLDSNKEVVGNNSPIYFTNIYGIGSNIISNSYNAGNIYSVIIEKCRISGIGAMTTAKNSNLGQYYNFLNYNVGNIYMYVGASKAQGIADQYAYKCYNSGNIYLYDGIINTRTQNNNYYSEGGIFSGVAGQNSAGCYNDGDIYISPSEWSIYNSESSLYKAISLSGVSQVYSSYITEENENGREIIIPTINNGDLIVDLDRNKFDPLLNTTNVDSSSYYPTFYIMGTGLGSYCYNYGTFEFIENADDETNTVQLGIAGIGGLYSNHWYESIENSINYSDISVDTSNTNGALRYLRIYGVGRNSINASNDRIISKSANLGDISFKGNLGGNLEIYALGGDSSKIRNSINLGDINIDKSSVINGAVNIRGVYLGNNAVSADSNYVMYGWYDGCDIPVGISTAFGTILNGLDKSKQYGQINVSGTFKGAVTITPVAIYRTTYNINNANNFISNGRINISDAEITGVLTVYGVSNGLISNSVNNTAINVSNVLLHNHSYFLGGVAGSRNLNNAPINVSNCLTISTSRGYNTYISGITHNLSSVSHCENRGDITVENCKTATVGEIEYVSPVLEGKEGTTAGSYDSRFVVSGIGYSGAQSSINFGNINVSDVNRCDIGGISYIPMSSIKECYNYGNITCDESGGKIRVGGICAYLSSGNKINDCYNFGKINITNPNSYYIYNENPTIYGGGLVGEIMDNSGISYSVNFGTITYNNTKGVIENSSIHNNTRNYDLCIGGVAGMDNRDATISNSMNYADVSVLNEDNMKISAGGISGYANLNTTTNAVCKNLINYGNVSVCDSNSETNQLVFCGGIIGCAAMGGKKEYKYGINYGTVSSETSQAAKTYIGAILGGAISSGMSYVIDKFVDLSTRNDSNTFYPLMGYRNSNTVKNGDNAINYTINDFSISDTTTAVSTSFGTTELVTLNKQPDGGLYAADFIFRDALSREISMSISNTDNGLMYQEYRYLSPYLQKYMVSKFGDDIKNYGAYVVIKGTRTSDMFLPGDKIEWSNEQEEEKIKNELAGLYGTFFRTDLISDEDINGVYSSLVSPTNRSPYTDFNIYAQQVTISSLAEIHDIGVSTVYAYPNTDTSYYQNFREYQTLIETHPAYDSNGNLSDTVTYTDINFYIAIDDIDSYHIKLPKTDENGEYVKDENGNIVYEIVDTGGNIYITQNYGNFDQDILSAGSFGSTIQIYKGDVVDVTDRIDKMNHYSDQYPEPWLTVDNLEESMGTTEDWGKSNKWDDSFDSDDEEEGYYTKEDLEWSMAVPFTTENDTKKVYTKVLGVVTSEDGLHKNIVVAHVIIDRYKPYSEFDGVTLQTPEDGIVKSTVDNGRLTAVTGMPSLTDKVNGVPKNDVTYYYLNDSDLKGENIQRYNWESEYTYPQITINAYNLDGSGKIYYDVYHQNRLPADGELYNDLEWNTAIETERLASGNVSPTGVVFDDQQKSTGVATIKLDGSWFYYGGYYRVNLYYERTKESDNQKHFATIFIAKEHSFRNTIGSSYIGDRLVIAPQTSGQEKYDSTHPLVDGMSTGYVAYRRSYYNSNALYEYYFNRDTNDCLDTENNKNNNKNYNGGNGLYYSLKGYLAEIPSSDIYLDCDNPIYNPSEDTDTDSEKTTDTDSVADSDTISTDIESPDTDINTDSDTDTEIPRGKSVILENTVKSIKVYQNKETGAFYPIVFEGVMDIMAENGDIRRYTVEHIQNGSYGENDEYTYDNPTNIYQNYVNKNGYPVVADSNGVYRGVVYGDETIDAVFTCQWTSKNVTLKHTTDIEKDGYNVQKLKVDFTPINSTDRIELTPEQIEEYFSKVTCSTNNTWTFTLKNSAPVGTYTLTPYTTYTMDLSKFTNSIKLYDNTTNEFISESVDNIMKWTVPYNSPLIIENQPNDESYLTEYNTSNDQYTPFIVEDSTVEGFANREVFIRASTSNQEIAYVGYEDVSVGDVRVDKFNIYSYVSKTEQQSDIRFKAPYMANVMKWMGDTSPFETVNGTWTELTPTINENGIKEYNLHIEYNEKKSEGEYSYSPSITYYKVIAEDGVTSTTYSVYVVPGVRNKFTSLEVAQASEISQIQGSQAYKDKIAEMFTESDEVYKELIESNGFVNATIKELNGNSVDLYQTKFFNELYQENSTEPYIYNLKSFAFDISVDLPAGYDYDILLFSSEKDSYTVLSDSQNGFDGKQLILSNSDDQQLHIRILLKKDKSGSVWGVQHIWNFQNANRDPSGKVLNRDGGYFYNYVTNENR